MLARVSTVFAALVLCASAAPMRSRQTTNTGDGTFFAPGLGACGQTSTDADLIVAVSTQFFQSFPGATANPNENPVCGKTITANFGGSSTTVTVVDQCEGCAEFDLDFSPAAFSQLADQSVGRLHGMTWTLN